MDNVLFSGELASLAGLSTDALKSKLADEEGNLKEGAAQTFASLVLDKFKAQEREAKEQHYQRGIREKGEAIEAALKPLLKQYDVNAGRAEEAIQELAEKIKGQPPTGGGNELTKEEIAKHPAFKSLLEERTTDVVAKWQEKHTALQSEYDQFKQAATREKLANTVRANTRAILEKEGRQPHYGTKGANAAINMFWAYHGLDNVKIAEDDTPQMLDKDGNVLRDEMSNPVSFDKFVESNWILGFKEAAGNGSPPHQPGRSGGQSAPNLSDRAAFDNAYNAAKTPQEKAELLKARAEALRKSEK